MCVLCQLPCDSSSTCTLCTCDDGRVPVYGQLTSYLPPLRPSMDLLDSQVHLATCLIEFIHTPPEPWFQTGSQMNWGLHPDNVVAQSYLDLDSVMTSFVPTVN